MVPFCGGGAGGDGARDGYGAGDWNEGGNNNNNGDNGGNGNQEGGGEADINVDQQYVVELAGNLCTQSGEILEFSDGTQVTLGEGCNVEQLAPLLAYKSTTLMGPKWKQSNPVKNYPLTEGLQV